MTHEECYACPVGAVFASLREASPEALSHLATAAAELAAAARAVLTALEASAARGGPGVSSVGIQRIPVV